MTGSKIIKGNLSVKPFPLNLVGGVCYDEGDAAATQRATSTSPGDLPVVAQ